MEGIHKVKFKVCDYFIEYQSVNNDLTKLTKNLKRCLRTHLSFLIMILINFFCC